ncbi:MAG: efflux RND transporter periplasmic adaptor subunit [Cytophagales bacterium]
MKNYQILSLIVAVTLASCQSNNQDGSLEGKKQQLDEARTELSALKSKIASLEKEIKAADPSFGRGTAVLVSPIVVKKGSFEHLTEVRGSAESRRNVTLSAQMGGEIRRVSVREGDRVAKGQVLVTLNTEVLASTLAEIKSSYELAKTVFERQEKLWNQKIGTEVQYLQAKNNKESLEKRIAATQAQMDQFVVRAPFGGLVDDVSALEGQMATPGAPLVRMVNAEDLYIRADVSEDFLGRVNKGDAATITIPALNKELKSTVSSVGQVINPENRTFSIEIRLPDGYNVKPNQVAIVSFRDYANANTFSVPTKIIQRDNKGQFVFGIETKGNTSNAKKLYVQLGTSYKGQTEVIEGLTDGQTIIGEGFRDVADGLEVTIAEQSASVTKK